MSATPRLRGRRTLQLKEAFEDGGQANSRGPFVGQDDTGEKLAVASRSSCGERPRSFLRFQKKRSELSFQAKNLQGWRLREILGEATFLVYFRKIPGMVARNAYG